MQRVKYLTAQAGSPYKTEAVTEAKGTDLVMFGSKDSTIVENAAMLNRTIGVLNMVSDQEGLMRLSSLQGRGRR